MKDSLYATRANRLNYLSGLSGIPSGRMVSLLLFVLCLFLLVGCGLETENGAARTQATCPEIALPWDIDWVPTDVNVVINRIDVIVAGSGLTEQGKAILDYSLEYGINPAFALAMFRKESSFAESHTRAYRTNNPGNIIATSDCRGLPSGSSCSGTYGEIGTDGRFGVYASMEDGIRAYFALLAAEYKPGSRRNCEDLSCIISAYCPAEECDEETYISQISDWTSQYQCQLVGSEEPIFLAPQPSMPGISATVVSATIPSTDPWLDTLLGAWEGEVYSSSLMPVGEGPYPWEAIIEKGPSGSLILTLNEEGVSHFLENGGVETPLVDSNQQYYCFSLYDSGGSGMQVGDRCFRPLSTDEMDYVGSDLVSNTWGVFTRVGNTQPTGETGWPDLEGRTVMVMLLNDSGQSFSTMGFDRMVVESVCELINCEPSFVETTDWGDAIDSVLSGRYDWLGVTSTITIEREAALDYAIPFYILGGNEPQSFAFPSGSDLVEPVSTALQFMLENGEIASLLDTWNIPSATTP